LGWTIVESTSLAKEREKKKKKGKKGTASIDGRRPARDHEPGWKKKSNEHVRKRRGTQPSDMQKRKRKKGGGERRAVSLMGYRLEGQGKIDDRRGKKKKGATEDNDIVSTLQRGKELFANFPIIAGLPGERVKRGVPLLPWLLGEEKKGGGRKKGRVLVAFSIGSVVWVGKRKRALMPDWSRTTGGKKEGGGGGGFWVSVCLGRAIITKERRGQILAPGLEGGGDPRPQSPTAIKGENGMRRRKKEGERRGFLLCHCRIPGLRVRRSRGLCVV